MEFELKKMTWCEFDERRKTSKTVIIPTGACEVYGPHLPLGSDILVAQGVARLLAEKVNGIVAPVCEVGQSKVLLDFPGTIAISADTLMRVYREIIEQFINWGFKNFFVISAHLHNTQLLNEVLDDFRLADSTIQYATVGWWQYLPNICGDDILECAAPHAHASEAGTSVMEYLYPELVRRDKLSVSENKYNDQYPGIIKGLGFKDYTDIGTIGNSVIASPEKGQKIVARAVEKMADYIKNEMENN